MRIILFIIGILLSTSVFSQLNRDTTRYIISQKTLDSFKYRVSYTKKSPRLKITCRTAFNKDALDQAMSDNDLSEMFDDVEFSQFLKYNLRVRWRTKKKYNIFIGAETLGASNPGPGQNAYYIVFKRRF
jgi:hypothetical protein